MPLPGGYIGTMRTQLGHNARIVVVLTVAVLGISLFALAQPKAERWVLPVADGSEEKPSPPSVHGYIADTSGRSDSKAGSS